ncbi:glycosyltransferase family 2 protein [Tepidanaerobacter acetatoxydans]|uniref:glycosyltransferase family 2 protein n=1 Tax=Tepidanaerobacter acetatoxydans TaxID=499229 RepID=UPI001BD24AE3|nr:glycosyltransferase [Tepidanaerobacter acetatoxydans]
MNVAVVPAKNEQGRIGKVLTLLQQTSVEKIVVVVNGSQDDTMQEIKALNMKNVEILYFAQELGIDIPRAIGAYQAYTGGAACVVFVDGDLVGNIRIQINELIYAITTNMTDLAMTDCYPELNYSSTLAEQTLFFRTLLNLNLGFYDKIGVATPSHGPHAVSRKLLELIDFRDFAVPPVVLAFAVRQKLSVDVPTKLPQKQLGSKIRNYFHAKKIADTIIGDTIEAINYFSDKPRTRCYLNKEYQGYNPFRRFDILEKFLTMT